MVADEKPAFMYIKIIHVVIPSYTEKGAKSLHDIHVVTM